MSEYIVATPFVVGTTRLSRGARIDNKIEKARNFRALLSDKYIVPFYDKKSHAEFVPGCYVVVKSFKKGNLRFKPGHFVDLRGASCFRNEGTLVSAGYMRRATKDEVASHSAHSPLSGSPDSRLSGDASAHRKLWNNPLWVKEQYATHSIPEMCKIAGCSTSTMWKAIKSLNIETRPRGRPASGK